MRYQIIKATPAQQAEYRDKKINGSVYPLCGFVWVGKRRLYIEDLPGGRDNPRYEVMAPDGMWFFPDGVTTLLCFSLYDLDSRLQSNVLERQPK